MALTRHGNVADAIDPQDIPAFHQISDASSGSVANAAALSALSIVNLNDGAIKFVKTFRSFFRLDKTNSDVWTPDGVVYITALGGVGIWVRLNLADRFWATQLTWYWDPISGNDENDGATLGTAFKTHEEFFRRSLGLKFANNVFINVLNNVPNQVYRLDCTALSIRYQAVLTPIGTGTFTGVTALNEAANQPLELTDSAIPTSWTVSGFVGKYLVAKNGATFVGSAFIDKDLGSKTVRMGPSQVSQPLLTPGPAAPIGQFLFAPGTFTVGNTYTVYDMLIEWAIPTMICDRIPIFWYGFKFTAASTGFTNTSAVSNSNVAMCIFPNTTTIAGRFQAIQCIFFGSFFPIDNDHGLLQNLVCRGNTQIARSNNFYIRTSIHISNGGTLQIKQDSHGGYDGQYSNIALFDVPSTGFGLVVDHQSSWFVNQLWGKDNNNSASVPLVAIGSTGSWLYCLSEPTVTPGPGAKAFRIGAIDYDWADMGNGITLLGNAGIVRGSD